MKAVNAQLLSSIKDLIPDIKKCGNKGWHSFPVCLACGKRRHHYFHTGAGHRCHKCGAHGSVKNLLTLLHQNGYHIPEVGIPLPSLELFWQEPDEAVEAQPLSIPIPPDAKPFTQDLWPDYFVAQRDFPLELILDLDMQYCTQGLYAMRIIVPLETLGTKAFLAYISRKDQAGKKVLYPTGCSASHFLFPYNYLIREETKRIILLEGITDAMRVLTHRLNGFHSDIPLALLGKNISDKQLYALSLLLGPSTEIVLALDWDTENAGTYKDTAAEAAIKLSRAFGRDRVSSLRMSHMPSQVADRALQEKRLRTTELERHKITVSTLDPDDIRHGEDWMAIMGARESMDCSLI